MLLICFVICCCWFERWRVCLFWSNLRKGLSRQLKLIFVIVTKKPRVHFWLPRANQFLVFARSLWLKYLARLAQWRDKNTVLVPSVDFYSVSNMIEIKEKIEIGVCLMSVFSFLQVYSVWKSDVGLWKIAFCVWHRKLVSRIFFWDVRSENYVPKWRYSKFCRP